MITPQSKVLITEVLDKYGPEKVWNVIQRSPQRGSWSNCFLAYLHGAPKELQRAIVTDRMLALSQWAHIRVAHVMGLTEAQVEVVEIVFDTHNWDFMDLVEEWLELNTVKKESRKRLGFSYGRERVARRITSQTK